MPCLWGQPRACFSSDRCGWLTPFASSAGRVGQGAVARPRAPDSRARRGACLSRRSGRRRAFPSRTLDIETPTTPHSQCFSASARARSGPLPTLSAVPWAWATVIICCLGSCGGLATQPPASTCDSARRTSEQRERPLRQRRGRVAAQLSSGPFPGAVVFPVVSQVHPSHPQDPRDPQDRLPAPPLPAPQPSAGQATPAAAHTPPPRQWWAGCLAFPSCKLLAEVFNHSI